jgi:hypothetical protein
MEGVKKFVYQTPNYGEQKISTIHLTSQLLPSKWTGLLTDWSCGLLKGAMDMLKSL